MTQTNRPRPGQAELKRFISDEIARSSKSVKAFLDEHNIPKSTYQGVIADRPGYASESFRRLEGALNLPRGILDWIAEGKPNDMATQFERELWEAYTYGLNDDQRARLIARLEEKHAAGAFREVDGTVDREAGADPERSVKNP